MTTPLGSDCVVSGLSEITIAGSRRRVIANVRPAYKLTGRYPTNAPTVAVEGITVAGR
jgi:PmbA protein